MVVYRGVTTMYYKKDNSDIFYNNTFMSTSLNPNTALGFSYKDCCMKKIILKPGFNRIIFIHFIESINLLDRDLENLWKISKIYLDVLIHMVLLVLKNDEKII